MYALVIEDSVLILDAMKHYGIYKQNDVSLSGFLMILNFCEVVSFCKEYDFNPLKIEGYLDFLFKICIYYLKEHLLL